MSGGSGSSDLYKAVEALVSQMQTKESMCRAHLQGGLGNIKKAHLKVLKDAKNEGLSIQQKGVKLAGEWLSDCIEAADKVIEKAVSSNLRDERLKDQIVSETTILLEGLHFIKRLNIQPPASRASRLHQPLHFGRDWGLPHVENMNALESAGYEFFGGSEIVNVHRAFRRAQCDHEIQYKRLLLLLGMELRKSGQMSAMQERNSWLYRLALQGMTWSGIIVVLKKRINSTSPEWDLLESVNGIKAAVEKHQEENPQLEPIKTRQPGRRLKGRKTKK